MRRIQTTTRTVLLSVLSGGLYAFAWLGIGGRRLRRRSAAAQLPLGLLPPAAALWALGAAFMAVSVTHEPIAFSDANPPFFFGFIVTTAALILLLAYTDRLSFLLEDDFRARVALRIRGALGTILALLMLMAQLVLELTPVRQQTKVSLVLFQVFGSFLLVGVLLQWFDRVQMRFNELLVDQTPLASSAAASEAAARTS